MDLSQIEAPQREVQRLLGRCVLRVQQYELLLKGLVASHEISGSAKTLEQNQVARVAEASDKTLGTLIGRLLGNYVVPEGFEPVDKDTEILTEPMSFAFVMRLTLRQVDYDNLKADMREFVGLRNSLVHHFIEQYDLWTVDGCTCAQQALLRTYADIDRSFEQLHAIAKNMDEARQAAVEAMKTPEFLNMVVNGIDPDGTVHWPSAGIVTALREACSDLAVDEWTNLDAAARWVSEHQPEQTPQKYGCSRWRQVVHESGQFELRRMTHNGQFGAWFRERVAEQTEV